MYIRSYVLLLLSLTFVFSTANSQIISIDSVDGLTVNGKLDVDRSYITFYIHIASDSSNHTGMTNGFQVYSPDGANWGGTVPDTLPLGWKSWFDLIFEMNTYSVDGLGADTVGFGAVSLFNTGLPALFNEQAYTITIGPISGASSGKRLIIDKSFYPPIGYWVWAGPDATPAWGGPYEYQFSGFIETINFDLTPDTIVKDVYQADLPAVSDSFEVSAWGITWVIGYDLTESIEWLTLDKQNGVTPDKVICDMVIPDDTIDTYFDSIMISNDNVSNSPQFVYVKLNIHDDVTDVNSGGLGLPDEFQLYQNYPNPFNPSTEIRFDLPEKSSVSLEVFNVLGQTVFQHFKEYPAGTHAVKFNGTSLPSGIYFYRLKTDKFVISKKMELLK